uniref:RRM domain-containing protein n=1 Tax=Clastoptera arizonana TaxID=38151 RepID=A0A1B6E7P8_9HEMI
MQKQEISYLTMATIPNEYIEIIDKNMKCKLCNVITPANNFDNHLKGRKHQNKEIEYELKNCTVFVRGIYSCTKEDLENTFSEFGEIKNITLFKKNCTICFKENTSKQKVINQNFKCKRDSLHVSDYKVYNSHDSKDIKEKDSIVKINTALDFDTQINSIVEQVKEDRGHNIMEVLLDIKSIFEPVLPGVQAVLFGSNLSGLALKNSDIDIFMECPGGQPDSDFVMNKAKIVFRSSLVKNVSRIRNARVPIVKLCHKKTNFDCDISFKTKLGFYNSKLIQFYLGLDRRIKPLLLVLKYWCKMLKLLTTRWFSNYALTMMFIFYLQQLEPQILPSVLELQKAAKVQRFVDNWNCSFAEEWIQPAYNTSSMKDLLLGFFKYYSEFDYDYVISPFLGKPFPVLYFKNLDLLPASMNLYKENIKLNDKKPFQNEYSIKIQDPFELQFNLASIMSSKDLILFKRVCSITCDIFLNKEDNCILDSVLNLDKMFPEYFRQNFKFQIKFNLKFEILSKILWEHFIKI